MVWSVKMAFEWFYHFYCKCSCRTYCNNFYFYILSLSLSPCWIYWDLRVLFEVFLVWIDVIFRIGSMGFVLAVFVMGVARLFRTKREKELERKREKRINTLVALAEMWKNKKWDVWALALGVLNQKKKSYFIPSTNKNWTLSVVVVVKYFTTLLQYHLIYYTVARWYFFLNNILLDFRFYLGIGLYYFIM